MIYIEVDGEPFPWKRPGYIKTRKNTIVYDMQKRDKEMVQWQISSQYRESPLLVPLHVSITFRMPIPESTTKKIKAGMLNGVIHHRKRPDVDNLEKFILDCMNGLVFADDSQICKLTGEKIYSEFPGTLIRIRPLSHNLSHEEEEREEQEELEERNGSNLRNAGPGRVPGDRVDEEGPTSTRRKENRVIAFRNG